MEVEEEKEKVKNRRGKERAIEKIGEKDAYGHPS